MIREATIRTMILALLLAVCATAPAGAAEPVKAVYHLNEGIPQATRAMRNIQNHLTADPTAKIVVVAHGLGVDFLLKEARDANGNAFSNAIEELTVRGVEFRVCQFTLESRKIDPKRVVPEAKIIPSGVAEVARVQAREGFAYVKP